MRKNSYILLVVVFRLNYLQEYAVLYEIKSVLEVIAIVGFVVSSKYVKNQQPTQLSLAFLYTYTDPPTFSLSRTHTAIP